MALPSKPVVLQYWPLLAALLIGLAGTGILFQFLWRDAKRADQVRFDTVCHFLQERLDDRMEKYEQFLVIIREYLTANPLPPQAQWRHFLDRLRLPVNCRGLLGLVYAPRVKDEELKRPSPALAEAIGGLVPAPGGRRGNPGSVGDCETWPMLYGYARPEMASPELGGNLLGSGLPWEPVDRAVYRNALTVSPRLADPLAKRPFNTPGFCMIHAVYNPDTPTDLPRREGESDQEAWLRLVGRRVQDWRGTLVGVVAMDPFLTEVVEDSELEVACDIFDNVNPDQRQRLNEQVLVPSAQDRLRRPDLANRVSIWPMYGSRWVIEFFPTAEFERRSPRRVAWLALWAGLGGTLGFTWLVGLQLRQRLQAEAHARQLNEAREVIESLSRERQAISRDLHDGVLQSLYALGLGLQKTRRAIRTDPRLAEERCHQNLDALELAMADLRRYLGSRQAAAHRALDLGLALRQLTESMNRQGSIPVQLELEPGQGASPLPGVILELVQLAREAMMNAQRHSGASLIRVSLSRRPGCLRLQIADNGRGFDAQPPSGQGHGLRNMQARAAEINAQYQIVTHPGAGVSITVDVPLPGPNQPDGT